MKKLSLFFVICVFATSCSGLLEKLSELTKFDMDFETQVEIPGTAGINLDVPLILKTPEVKTNAESTFENNNTSKDLVEEVTLKEMTLTVSSPEEGNMNFLNSISISLIADGLEPIQIAWKEEIPDNSSEISLDVYDGDLKEYLLKDSFKLEVETYTDEAPTQDYVIDVYTNFGVDAEVLGL